MRHQLIMVTGSCPGAGKSTMTEFLAEQLTAQGVPIRCLHEDDAAHLDVFAPMRQSFRTEHPNVINILLAFSKTLVREFVHTRVHLIDALLPGYHYLFGLYPTWRVGIFNADLYGILCPLHPTIVYLKSDIDSAFARATEERGKEWLDRFMERINRHYQTARHVRTSLPLKSTRDVVAFFKEMDQLMLGMVKEWPGERLVIDTLGRTVDEIKTTLTDRLLSLRGTP